MATWFFLHGSLNADSGMFESFFMARWKLLYCWPGRRNCVEALLLCGYAEALVVGMVFTAVASEAIGVSIRLFFFQPPLVVKLNSWLPAGQNALPGLPAKL